MSLDEFKNIAAEKLGFSPCIPKPYKLCDFKPAYGLIAEDFIQGYEYWGHCDCDLLFGNLSGILTPILDLNYDKIFAVGHLTIYKNTYENNRIFMREHNGVLLYKNVFTSERIWGFDESQCDLGGNNVHEIFKQSKASVYEDDLSFNVYTEKDEITRVKYNPQTMDYETEDYVPSRVYWDGKNIVRIAYMSGKIIEQHYLYTHLQSRIMSTKSIDFDRAPIEILPDRFRNVVSIPSNKQEFHLFSLRMPSTFWLHVYKKKIRRKFLGGNR
ncbi:hypothetical protein I6E06_01725 [Bifidobacterium boum]|nr:hypothetical protein [Bifidobacterium boum]